MIKTFLNSLILIVPAVLPKTLLGKVISSEILMKILNTILMMLLSILITQVKLNTFLVVIQILEKSCRLSGFYLSDHILPYLLRP